MMTIIMVRWWNFESKENRRSEIDHSLWSEIEQTEYIISNLSTYIHGVQEKMRRASKNKASSFLDSFYWAKNDIQLCLLIREHFLIGSENLPEECYDWMDTSLNPISSKQTCFYHRSHQLFSSTEQQYDRMYINDINKTMQIRF